MPIRPEAGRIMRVGIGMLAAISGLLAASGAVLPPAAGGRGSSAATSTHAGASTRAAADPGAGPNPGTTAGLAGTTAGLTALGTPAGTGTTAGLTGPALPGTGAAGQRQALARLTRVRMLLHEPGTVTGVVHGSRGTPVAGACVSARGPARTVPAVTGAGGRYFLSGLPAGRYTISYRACRTAGGQFLPWPAAAVPPRASQRVLVTGGHLTTLPAVTLPPATPAGQFAPGRPARLSPAQPRAAAASPWGGISGRVTDRAGHPLKGICVTIHSGGGYEGITTPANGTYRTGLTMPPGTYQVQFIATCNNSGGGNWAPVWYRNTYRKSAATKVKVRAGKTTKGIDGVMHRGGQITGTVASRAGQKLSGVCVSVVTGNGTQASHTKSKAGHYRIWALDAGRYHVMFEPGCGLNPSVYLPQWWKKAATFATSAAIGVRLGKRVSHIDARLVRGGQITGVVRLTNASGQPLAGMCVFVSGRGPVSPVNAFTATGADGTYRVVGLPTGRYDVAAGPGCNDNGNYVYRNYPHPVPVTAGKTTAHINVYLPAGGIMTGTVTDAAHGTPVAGACVFINDYFGDGTVTGADGTYRVDQLPASHSTVELSGGCGNKGSYAPQWWHGESNSAAADRVTITAGQTTAGVSAALSPGASITGHVTAASGRKLSDVCVGAGPPSLTSLGFVNAVARTHQGAYTLRNLAPGQYQVGFFNGCGPGGNWATQWFRGQPGTTTADIVNIPAASTVTGINAVLRRGGAVSGTVRVAGGGHMRGVCMLFTDTRTGVTSEFDQFGDGFGYQVTGLAPGTYTVEFDPCVVGDNLAIQWYDNRATPGAATPVTVTAGHDTKGISAVLHRGGTISGRVTAKAGGTPVRNVCVFAESGRYLFGFGTSNARGRYRVAGLSTASYRVVFSLCFGGGADLAGQIRPGRVHATAGRAVTGVNAALDQAGMITGTVRGGAPVQAQPGICAYAYPVAKGGLASSATAGRTGFYRLRHLAAGTYKVYFDPSCQDGPQPLAPQWFNGQPSKAKATAVMVTAGQTTPGIDATLLPDGAISGTVTGPGPAHSPLTGICIRAVPLPAAASGVYAVTSNGGYLVTGLTPGRYRVQFQSGCGLAGYATQWWQDAPSKARAAIITVIANTTTTGINAAMKR